MLVKMRTAFKMRHKWNVGREKWINHYSVFEVLLNWRYFWAVCGTSGFVNYSVVWTFPVPAEALDPRTLALLRLQDHLLSQSHNLTLLEDPFISRCIFNQCHFPSLNQKQDSAFAQWSHVTASPAKWMTSSSCGPRKGNYWGLRAVPPGQMWFLLSSAYCYHNLSLLALFAA